ncbi:LysR family transcriptional regulator [Cypionkella sp.]|uniref:LysR family transcriptional regulator n=1 Tax=Cypionkella sp. TaxID=2811411 RepID=UPI003750D3BA
MENWDEIRTAYQVARMGTVSGAAEAMGVHHATVIRHIDALEKRLGAKLFQRHARGYTATEAGRDLLVVAQTTEEQFGQLASRIKGQGEQVAGELVVTSITGVTALLAPVFASFQAQYPAVVIRYLTDMRLFRLDYGEAHVAIRAGSAPQEPDNVVMPFVQMRAALYASRSYIDTYGQPQTEADLAQHRFVYTDTSGNRAPFYKWLADRVPEDRLTFRVSLPDDSLTAVKAGLGLGFVPVYEAKQHADLVQVLAPIPDWQAPLWLVTHVDLHRTLKVQSFLSHLKAAAAAWGDL